MRGRSHAALPAPVRSLVRHFRAQRPLRGGSLLVTIFGDAIAPRGGAVTLGSLIRLAAPFGLTERLVRTSVARLARQGWLAARRAGRRSEYRLTRTGARRFAEATRRIYGANPHAWNAAWTLVLLPDRPHPARLRRDLRWLGFGQLTPAVFVHPACTPQQARESLRTLRTAPGALVLASARANPRIDRVLAARGWDLAALARAYRRLLVRFSALATATAAARPAPETAFVIRTLLIHQYRKIHLRDPLLPPALLPRDWVGTAAYEVCRRLYARVFVAAEEHLTVSARRLHRPLPAANAAAYARFGGLGLRRATAVRRQALRRASVRQSRRTPAETDSPGGHP